MHTRHKGRTLCALSLCLGPVNPHACNSRFHHNMRDGGILVANSWKDRMDVRCSVHAEAAVVCLHATAPHCSEELVMKCSCEKEKLYEVRFSCGRCKGTPKETTSYQLPCCLFGAAAILFHASHEGHPFRMEIPELGHDMRSPGYDTPMQVNRNKLG